MATKEFMRGYLTKELSVPQTQTAGPVNFDSVLVIRVGFHNASTFVPLGRVPARLILNKNPFSMPQRQEQSAATLKFLQLFLFSFLNILYSQLAI